MENTRLSVIIEAAKKEGFSVRYNKTGAYAIFSAPITDGSIRVDFERNYVKQVDEVFLKWSAATVTNLDYAEMFSEWLNKAVSLMKELQKAV